MHNTLNEWFLSLHPERQKVLSEDKWLLANAAFEAAKNESKIYIVVRNTEDSDFNQISSFYSVHLTEVSAMNAVKKYIKDNLWLAVKDFEILEREAN